MTRIGFLWTVALLCCSALASGRPDFSGTWKLDTAKSSTWKIENGQTTRDGGEDTDYVQTVAISGEKITVSTKAQGVSNVFDGTFPLDNKPHVTTLGPHLYRFTRVGWDPGNTLIFEINDKDGKKDISKVTHLVRETWTLSPDGKVLTRFRRTADPGKLTDQKYVLNKQ